MLRDLKLGQGGRDQHAAGRPGSSSLRATRTPSCGRRRGRGSTSWRSTACPPQGSPICTGPAPGVHVKVVQDPAIRHALQWAIDRKTIVARRLAQPGARRGTASSRPTYASARLLQGLVEGSQRSATTTTRPRPGRSSRTAAGCAPPAASAPRTASRPSSRCCVLSDTPEDQQTALRIQAWAEGGRASRSTSRSRPRTPSTPRSTTRPAPRARPTAASTSRPTTPSCGAGAATCHA